jgi:hypothetical protein
MKYKIITILSLLALVGCNQKPKQSVTQKADNMSISIAKPIEDTIKFLFNPIDSPLTICGITTGVNADSDVVKKYGKGYYIKNLGHGGGRLYVDSIKGLTLITTIGVDYIIEQTELYQGVERPKYSKYVKLSKKAFAHNTSIDNSTINGLELGVSANTILKSFGKPIRSSETKEFKKYEYWYDFSVNKPREDFPFITDFKFRNDSLVSISCEQTE